MPCSCRIASSTCADRLYDEALLLRPLLRRNGLVVSFSESSPTLSGTVGEIKLDNGQDYPVTPI